MVIKRIWHGWTTPESPVVCQKRLKDEIFPGIEAKHIPGCLGIDLLRRHLGDEVEFVTIMTFASLQNVIDFQGEGFTHCYVPESAQRVLQRGDKTSSHDELIEARSC
jgi:hypothetical protein